MHWDQLYTLNPTAVPPTCLQEDLFPAPYFKPKRADELAGEMWSDELYKEPLIWPCWLCIAHLFPPNSVRLQI